MEEHDKLSNLTMWSKIKEFISDGLNFSEISRWLEIDRHTVSLYTSMSYDEFVSSQSYNRLYSHKLDAYEDYVVVYLSKYPEVSAWMHRRQNKRDYKSRLTCFCKTKRYQERQCNDKPSCRCHQVFQPIRDRIWYQPTMVQHHSENPNRKPHYIRLSR